MEIILYVLGGLVAGFGGGRFLLKGLYKSEEIAAQNKAKKILKDAEENAEEDTEGCFIITYTHFLCWLPYFQNRRDRKDRQSIKLSLPAAFYTPMRN